MFLRLYIDNTKYMQSMNSLAMDRRENVLLEALHNNAKETDRWEAYRDANIAAIENLKWYSQHLTVDIMVPVCKKALMPGELYHTNEILVGHYQGYFSKCSAHKAIDICEHRLSLAKDHLKKLETEENLWQKKLDMPILEGAMPNAGEMEIVEDFDEEAHKKWILKHKISVRKEKMQERAKRQENLNSNDENYLTIDALLSQKNLSSESIHQLLNNEKNNDLNQLLSDLEKQELQDKVDIEPVIEESMKMTDDLVHSLMSNQIPLPDGKIRLSRKKNPETIDGAKKDGIFKLHVEELNPIFERDTGIINDQTNLSTSENQVSSTIPKSQNNAEIKSGEDSIDEDSDDEEVPEEVQLIRKQMELLPVEAHENFLRLNIKHLSGKLRNTITSQNKRESSRIMESIICLEDDLEELLLQEELAMGDTVNNGLTDNDNDADKEIKKNTKSSKQISFATSDEKIEYRPSETVAQLLNNSKQQQSRDVIALDPALQHVQTPILPTTTNKPSTSPQVIQRVERNLEFMNENQSTSDFDLVNQILNASTGNICTQQITFKHSMAEPSIYEHSDDLQNSIPRTPADFYDYYEKAKSRKSTTNQSSHDCPIYVNGFKGEDQVKVPILNEASRSLAYEDPRIKLSKLSNETSSAKLGKKSLEQNETKLVKSKQKNKKSEMTINFEDMSAYQKVMKDLIEKEPTAPEPLPEGKFIDSHTPRNRISRFKKERALHK